MTKKEAIKVFENRTIRSLWDNDTEEWYFSVVDVIAVLTDSPNPQVYWRVLKKRLKDEDNQTVTHCNGFKMKASDGKMRNTDCVAKELVINMLAELSTKEISEVSSPNSFDEHKEIAEQGGEVALNARIELEVKTGRKVVSQLNAKSGGLLGLSDKKNGGEA